jgi:methionyl aminopeptidase
VSCPSSCRSLLLRRLSLACGVHLFCQGGRSPAANAPALINGNKAVKHRQQLSPVSIPVADLYQNKIFPEGEIQPYAGEFGTRRIGSEEMRAADRVNDVMLNEIREAAEVHRQVRQDFMRWVKPGLTMIEIAQYIERGTRAGLKSDGLKRGWAFPTGLSLNHVAAHYSPNYKDTTVLHQGDVMKVNTHAACGVRV